MSLRLPPEVKAKLEALSVVDGRPQWRVAIDAIECYFRERSEDDKRTIEELVRRKSARRR